MNLRHEQPASARARHVPGRTAVASAALLGLALLAGCSTVPERPQAPASTGPGAPAAALPAPTSAPTSAGPADDSLFLALGGHAGIRSLTEQFIRNIADDETLRPEFRNVNITRFHTMLQEQLCAESGGGCTYTGDDMRRAHAGLDITRAQFNAVVEALADAMDARGLPVPVQNRVLALHAPKRADVLGE